MAREVAPAPARRWMTISAAVGLLAAGVFAVLWLRPHAPPPAAPVGYATLARVAGGLSVGNRPVGAGSRVAVGAPLELAARGERRAGARRGRDAQADGTGPVGARGEGRRRRNSSRRRARRGGGDAPTAGRDVRGRHARSARRSARHDVLRRERAEPDRASRWPRGASRCPSPTADRRSWRPAAASTRPSATSPRRRWPR